MNRIVELTARYDAAIWVRVIGTMLTTVSGFMLRPFLALYLYDKLGGSIIMSMAVLGLQPISGILMNIWGGSLTDRYGRKPLMLGALIIQTICMIGFAFAGTLWEFAIWTILNGAGMSMFFPAANAQVADVVPEERRAEVFALLHTALNIGAAVGPLLGLAIFTQNPALVFAISAFTSFVYALIVWWKIPETLPDDVRKNFIHNKAPKLKISEHMNLFWLTLFAMPVGMLYTQVESTFPLFLKEKFSDYLTIFAMLMTINGTTVILLQMWIAKQADKFKTYKVIGAAYVLFAIVAFGYGFSPVFALLVMVEIVFTLGEMMNGPQIQKAIALMSPPEMRGRYFSISGLSWMLSRAIGPVLGGLVLAHFGGKTLFAVLGIFLLLGGIGQFRLIRKLQNETQQAVPAGAAVAVE